MTLLVSDGMVEKNFPQAIYGEILAEIESLLHALSNSGEDSKFDNINKLVMQFQFILLKK
ncbi:hypothetical protein EfmAA242_31730 (plasmid) [Enterococcus faecium]|nr:hypothetical protein EfmAA242_31730 [Enterococcus faecium]